MNRTMRRLAVISGFLTATLLLACLSAPARAEQVTVVQSSNIEAYNRALEGFRKGYGKPFTLVSLADDPDPGQLGAPDVLVAVGRKALEFCTSKTSSRIPVVILMTLNVDRRAMGGRSFVAIEPMVPVESRIRFVEEAFPDLLPAGFITGQSDDQKRLRELRQHHDLRIETVKASSEIPMVYPRLLQQVASVVLLPDPVVLSKDTAGFIFLKSLESGKALIVYSEGLVKKGALLGLLADNEDQGEAAARILRNGASGVLGRQDFLAPDKIEILINENTASTLGITIPEKVRARARIIK